MWKKVKYLFFYFDFLLESAFIAGEFFAKVSFFVESTKEVSTLLLSVTAAFGVALKKLQAVKDKQIAKAMKPNLNTFFMLNFLIFGD